MKNLIENKDGKIVKMETDKNLSFEEVQLIANKFELVVTNHQGDFLTLTIAGTKNGLMVSNVSDPSAYNKWTLYSGTDGIHQNNTIPKDVFEKMQPVFKELKSL